MLTLTIDSRRVLGGAAALLVVLAAWSGATRWERIPQPPPPASPALHAGPGGPVLVVADPDRPIGWYLCEILRSEGLNAFASTGVQKLTVERLRGRSVVVLAEVELDERTTRLLESWVRAGGTLIAMRPEPRLLPLMGLSSAEGAVADAYLRIDTSTAAGQGLVAETIQYHGAAARHPLAGATVVARLYEDAHTPTAFPAVSAHAVGNAGGRAIAFAYDLARSVVMTRQGNPRWQSQERDGIPPRRSNDLFYGASESDPKPDWVDLEKIAIPQADEQQRLLANLIVSTSLEGMPLPRFWYLPHFHRAIVLMTGDHHGCCAKTGERFQRYVDQSPEGCDVDDWECVRASAYVYPNAELETFDAAAWHALGFEIGVHVDTNCTDWDPGALDRRYMTPQLDVFSLRSPHIPGQASERTHCVAWSDWATHARALESNGIRLDTNYYFWPPEWVGDRPGLFTGSALPMRFADLDGNMIDVYQAATQMTDESGQSYPRTAEVLLDRAIGSEGYFGVFTANMHMDQSPHPGSDAIVMAALERGIPIVSGRQLLTWLDGRNLSRFEQLSWDSGEFAFEIHPAPGARNLRAMLPLRCNAGTLAALTSRGRDVAYDSARIKGIDYAVFEARAGGYRAQYVDSESH